METSSKRRALGMGLEELFHNEPLDYSQLEEKIITSTPKEEIVELNLSELRSNPYQPRKNFDQKALQELADSIKEHGVFQPIIAKKSVKGYEIIAGERRVKASIMAGKETIPAIVRDFSDEDMMEIALLENLQRENLNALEEAEAYKKLITTLSITQEDLAKRIGKSRSHITNMLGLLTLPAPVKELVVNGSISMGHARTLSKIENEQEVISLANRIINENLSVRDIEEITSGDHYEKKQKVVRKNPAHESDYSYIEESLCELLGTKVKVGPKKLVISFVNDSDLNRIFDIIEKNNRGE